MYKTTSNVPFANKIQCASLGTLKYPCIITQYLELMQIMHINIYLDTWACLLQHQHSQNSQSKLEALKTIKFLVPHNIAQGQCIAYLHQASPNPRQGHRTRALDVWNMEKDVQHHHKIWKFVCSGHLCWRHHRSDLKVVINPKKSAHFACYYNQGDLYLH